MRGSANAGETIPRSTSCACLEIDRHACQLARRFAVRLADELDIAELGQPTDGVAAFLCCAVGVTQHVGVEVWGAGKVEIWRMEAPRNRASSIRSGVIAASSRTRLSQTTSGLRVSSRCDHAWRSSAAASGTSSMSTSPYWLTGAPIQVASTRPAMRSTTIGHTMTRRPPRRPVGAAAAPRRPQPGSDCTSASSN